MPSPSHPHHPTTPHSPPTFSPLPTNTPIHPHPHTLTHQHLPTYQHPHSPEKIHQEDGATAAADAFYRRLPLPSMLCDVSGAQHTFNTSSYYSPLNTNHLILPSQYSSSQCPPINIFLITTPLNNPLSIPSPLSIPLLCDVSSVYMGESRLAEVYCEDCGLKVTTSTLNSPLISL